MDDEKEVLYVEPTVDDLSVSNVTNETETPLETATETVQTPKQTNEVDYKSLYEELLKEHESLQAKYKERFSDVADLNSNAELSTNIAQAIDDGDNTQISDLFEESGKQQAEGLSGQIGNIANSIAGTLKDSLSFTEPTNGYKGTTSEQVGRAIGNIPENLKENKIGETDKYDIRKEGIKGAAKNLIEDLFE